MLCYIAQRDIAPCPITDPQGGESPQKPVPADAAAIADDRFTALGNLPTQDANLVVELLTERR